MTKKPILKLTGKQRRFCEEYVIDWNGTRAAIAAGYSKKTAHVIAQENLRKPYIEEYLDEIQKDIAKLAGVSALRNAQEFKKIAFSNITDFKDGWMSEVEFDNLSQESKAALSEIQYIDRETKFGNERIVKFKLHDKMKALENLNKMFGFESASKIDHTTNGKDLPAMILNVDPLESYDSANDSTSQNSES